MNRKLLFVLAASIVSLSTLTGCGGGEPSSIETASSSPITEQDTAIGSGDLLDQIQQKGEIVIATEGTWAPWTYHNDSGELVGFDVEVAQAVAEQLGVKASFVEGEWDGLLAGLDASRYDMMANGVEVNETRAEKYDFSVPYAYIHTAIIVRGDDDSIHSFEDLDGKTTANTLASTYATLAESYGATATGVDDLVQTIQLLQQGRVDATLNAEVTFYDYMNQHPEANLKIAALTDDASRVCFPFRKGAETERLRAAVDQAVEKLREDGTLAALSEKYFDRDLTAEDGTQQDNLQTVH